MPNTTTPTSESDYFMHGDEPPPFDGDISITLATPPVNTREICDNYALRTPASDYASSVGSHSPCLSDSSVHSPFPEANYTSPYSDPPLTPADSSSSAASMFGAMSLGATSPYQYLFTTFPSTNQQVDVPLSPLVYTSQLSDDWDPFKISGHGVQSSGTYALSSHGHDDGEGSDSLLFERPYSHPVLADRPAPPLRRSFPSRPRPDMRAATTTFGPDLLMVPLPRRNSSNDQRPDVFFPENGASPDTPSSTSAFSSFPSSPSASGGASPTVLHPQVASSANLRASNSRRKKAALFRCIYYPECPATFTARHNLKNHVNSHAGIRPHRCPRCHHTFTTMAVMKRHLKKCKT